MSNSSSLSEFFLTLLIVGVVFTVGMTIMMSVYDKSQTLIQAKRNPKQVIVNNANVSETTDVLHFRPRVDGMYVSTFHNGDHHIKFFMFFNSHNLVGCANSSEVANEKMNVDIEALKSTLLDFAEVSTFEPFEDIARFTVTKNFVHMTFFEPDNHKAYEAGIINKDHYARWEGEFLHNGLVMSRYDSYLNYNLQRYVEDKSISNLKFTFVPIKF